MGYWPDGVDTGAATGGTELYPGRSGGRAWAEDAQGHEPRPAADEPLRPARIAALGLLFAAVGWPTLLFIDYALQVFLAYVI